MFILPSSESIGKNIILKFSRTSNSKCFLAELVDDAIRGDPHSWIPSTAAEKHGETNLAKKRISCFYSAISLQKPGLHWPLLLTRVDIMVSYVSTISRQFQNEKNLDPQGHRGQLWYLLMEVRFLQNRPLVPIASGAAKYTCKALASSASSWKEGHKVQSVPDSFQNKELQRPPLKVPRTEQFPTSVTCCS